MPKHFVVVGAGLGGLSAASILAHAGHSVDVYESAAHAGGKAGSITMAGCRFDTGPSLVTMPWVFEEFFNQIGLHMKDHLHFTPLDPLCRYSFASGAVLHTPHNPAQLSHTLHRALGESEISVNRFISYIRRMYETAGSLFLTKSLSEWSTLADPAFWKALGGLFKIDPFRTMEQGLARFFNNPLTRQLFGRYATYNGSSPYRTPAILNLIPWVEYGYGGYLPAGGITAIPRALEKAAVESGVTIHKETPVERILLDNKRRVKGISAGGREIKADAVISNADVLYTYRKLLGEPDCPPALRYSRLEPSSSGIVFYWAMDRVYPELKVNNIFFSRDYPAEFSGLFDTLTMPGEPTVYVNITSKLVKEDAPEGWENWFVLVNAPRDAGQDWNQITDLTRENVIRILEKRLGHPVRAHIRAEDVLTPPQIEQKTGSSYGSLYGISSNTPAAAFMRQPNRSRYFKGLYFCGGSAHPGGGMPLAVLSGRIAAGLALKYEK